MQCENDLSAFHKIYTCDTCGCEFASKFQDYERCITCLSPVFNKIKSVIVPEKIVKPKKYTKRKK